MFAKGEIDVGTSKIYPQQPDNKNIKCKREEDTHRIKKVLPFVKEPRHHYNRMHIKESNQQSIADAPDDKNNICICGLLWLYFVWIIRGTQQRRQRE